MLNSNELKYKTYRDSRVRTAEGFVCGQSGPLLLGESDTGERYIIKHTFPANAANEYVGCWLAAKLGVPAPRAYLLTPNERFGCSYAVAIEFLEDLRPFRFDEITDRQKRDVLGHMSLAHFIRNMDRVQMNTYRDRVVSYDFSDSFEMTDMSGLLELLQTSEERGEEEIRRIFTLYRRNLTFFDYDLPETAASMNMDRAEAHKIMLEVARRVLDIPKQEISEMGDELAEIYPLHIAVYYEECVHAMQKFIDGVSVAP